MDSLHNQQWMEKTHKSGYQKFLDKVAHDSLWNGLNNPTADDLNKTAHHTFTQKTQLKMKRQGAQEVGKREGKVHVKKLGSWHALLYFLPDHRNRYAFRRVLVTQTRFPYSAA